LGGFSGISSPARSDIAIQRFELPGQYTTWTTGFTVPIEVSGVKKCRENESVPPGVARVTAKRQDCRVTFLDRIVRDPAICAGQPVVRGTRVLVRVVLGYLAHGESTEHILREFPSLTEEDVRAVIAFAAASAGEDLPAPSPIPPNARVA
jgi:uncharacterized protein (DUF433 family)